MTQTQERKRSTASGFTIIEVMIVLAIAGLILLIVFLAVPALQRSSRNTQRKNDSAAISGAIANFIDNNAGSLPDKVGVGTSPQTLVLSCKSGCNGNTESTTLGYYSPATDVKITPNANKLDKATTAIIYIDTGINCSGLNSPRSAAIVYAVENGNGNSSSQQCVEQ